MTNVFFYLPINMQVTVHEFSINMISTNNKRIHTDRNIFFHILQLLFNTCISNIYNFNLIMPCNIEIKCHLNTLVLFTSAPWPTYHVTNSYIESINPDEFCLLVLRLSSIGQTQIWKAQYINIMFSNDIKPIIFL